MNPSYPGFDSKTGSCLFNLRLHSDVCQVAMVMMTVVHGNDGDDGHDDDDHKDDDQVRSLHRFKKRISSCC